MKRFLRALGAILLVVLGLLLVSMATALAWINTGWGKHYVIERVASAVPGLSVGDLSGLLPFDWAAHRVAYDAPSAPYRATIDVVDMHTSIRRSLATRALVISSVRFLSPHVTWRSPPSPSAPKSPGPQGPPHLPISISVERFTVEGGRVTSPSSQRSDATIDVTGALSAGPRGAALRISNWVATWNAPTSSSAATGPAGAETKQTARATAQVEGRIAWPDESAPKEGSLDARQMAARWGAATVHAYLRAEVEPFGSRGPIDAELSAIGPLHQLVATANIVESQGGSFLGRGDWDVAGSDSAHPYAMDLVLRSFDPSGVDPRLPRGALTLEASAAGRGRPLSSGSTLRARLNVAPSHVGKARIEDIALGIEQQDERWRIVKAEADVAAIRMNMVGGGVGRSFDVRAHAVPVREDLGRAFGDLRVRGAFDAVIRGPDPSHAQIRASGHVESVEAAKWRARNIRLAASIERVGSSVRDGAFRLTAEDIEQVQARSHDKGRALSRGLRRVALRAKAADHRLSVAAIAYPFLQRADGRALSLPPLRVSAEQQQDGRAQAPAKASTRPIRAEIDWQRVPLRAADQALGRDDPVSGVLDVHLLASGSVAEPHLSLTTTVDQPQIAKTSLPEIFTTAWVEARSGETRGEMTARVGSRPIMEMNGEIAAGPNQLRAPVSLRTAALKLAARIPEFPLAELVQRGAGPRLGGTIDGCVHVDGTAAAPRGEGRLRLVDGSIDSTHFGSMTLDVENGKQGARASVAIRQNAANTLEGQLSYNAARALDLDLRASSFDLSALQKIAPSLRALTPNINGQLTVKGHLGPAVPRAEGRPSRRPLIFDIDLSHAELGLVLRQPSKNEGDESRRASNDAGRSQASFQQAMPLDLHHLEVHDSRLFIVAPDKALDAVPPPLLTVSDIQLSLENLANRPELLGKDPSVLAVRATVQEHSKLVVFATLDPTAPEPTLAGQAELRNLSLANVQNILRQETGLVATRGTFDCFVRFIVENGEINGGIKPDLKNADVKPADQSLWSKIKASAANLFLSVFHSEARGKNRVATVIPIEGRLSNPNVQLVPSVLGIVRNAFVVGLAGGFDRLPPPKSGQRQNVIEQTGSALKPQKNAPEAQPPRSP